MPSKYLLPCAGGFHGLRVWMPAALQTMVVTSNGLALELTPPVPHVMARRQGKEARFVRLLEIAYFREIGQNSWQVVGNDCSDTFTITSDGKLDYQRRTRGRRNDIRR
ncbi:MAG TPA: hypothetical protein VFZ34_09325 [Blastocatellia bacterium]|nr:hypothetical protein [Blastocatellia bacterium]